MKIKSLQKIVELKPDQFVVINDQKNNRTLESESGGWVFEPDYDYAGFNYEEIERILNLSVSAVEFGKYSLRIWAY